MCCSLFTIVQYNRNSSRGQLQWIYEQGVRHIYDILSAFWQQFQYSQREIASHHIDKMCSVLRLYCRVIVKVTVWTYLCGWGRWPGRGQCFCDKHQMWLQCITRNFHSLNNTFKHPILPFPSTIIHFLFRLQQHSSLLFPDLDWGLSSGWMIPPPLFNEFS